MEKAFEFLQRENLSFKILNEKKKKKKKIAMSNRYTIVNNFNHNCFINNFLFKKYSK